MDPGRISNVGSALHLW
uniref:Uncharacterized protein n=1 Tax=Arundo donax TaxID=35708 RepID=A0A0A8Y2C5_ARUDO